MATAAARKGKPKTQVAVTGPVETASSRSVAILDDGLTAMIEAAIKRGAAMVATGKQNKKSKPAEGSRRVMLTVEIEGDITVGKSSPGTTTRVPDFSHEDLLAAILGSMGPSRRRSLIEDGVARIKRAMANGESALLLERDTKDIATQILAVAKSERIAKNKTVGVQTGKVLGSPRVRVTGSIDTQGVEIEVTTDAAGAGDEGDDD